MKRYLTSCLLALVVISSLAAHDAHAAPANTLRVALGTGATTFDPAFNDLPAGDTVDRLVFNGLFRFDDQDIVQKDLAEQYTYSDDGLTLTVVIARGRVFSNGRPLDAAAVAASFERLLSPATGSIYRGLYGALGKVEATSSNTVVFHLAQKNGHILTLLASSPAKIVDVKQVAEAGTEFGRKPVGSGPYLVDRFIGGESYRLVRNPKYNGPAPATLDAIEFVIAPEDGSRMALLQTGDVQIAERVPAESMDSIRNLPDATVVTGPDMFSLNLEMVLRGPLADKRVREALNLAVDRAGIIKGLLRGLATPSVGMPGPGTQDALRTTFAPIPFDPKKAQALLAEAGIKPGQLALTLTCPNGRYVKDAQICQALAGSFSAIGVKVKANVIDRASWTVIVNSPVDARKDNFAMVGRGTAGMDYTLYRLFHTGVDSNRSGFSNPQVDKLLEEGRQSTDPAQQKDLYGQIQKIIWDERPYVFLWYPMQAYGISKKVQGFVMRPDETMSFERAALK
ncbi:ABC transporter substrate-binding protein [Caballeronia sp. LZ035]|uniref:ABC transporter substrate-binding protein n=1 Tax=Caballeronia sp. LZ035 TaxID=3038568 RepID=UPI00285A2D3E|nr:ABC transporter substrate-binding protein [Caballeronia sp. LZ035]MDR5758791.1 ABC transporter substrate-binding protein [Caballeronia sp. LZ035]